MFYVYDYNYGTQTATVDYADPDDTNLHLIWRWYDHNEKPDHVIMLETTDDGLKLPDMGPYRRHICFFSERIADIFRRYSPEPESEYADAICKVLDVDGVATEVAYTLIKPIPVYDCVDESRSIFIAQESLKQPGVWLYVDIEVLALKEEMLLGTHHFKIKGFSRYNFISEALAKELITIADDSMTIAPVDEFFKVKSWEYKKILETGDAYAPRTIPQHDMFEDKETYQKYIQKYNVRRRNLNDT